MPRVLSAAAVNARALADTTVQATDGTFPGATVYPAATAASTYPGRGSTLAPAAITPRTLTETPA